MFLLVDVTTAYRCDVSYNVVNQSLPTASLAIENGLGILFWAANWEASLLTSSRVHPKYFRSINKEIFNKLLFKSIWNNWFTPQFWSGGLKRVPILSERNRIV
jgi:hypothetical protein